MMKMKRPSIIQLDNTSSYTDNVIATKPVYEVLKAKLRTEFDTFFSMETVSFVENLIEENIIEL